VSQSKELLISHNIDARAIEQTNNKDEQKTSVKTGKKVSQDATDVMKAVKAQKKESKKKSKGGNDN